MTNNGDAGHSYRGLRRETPVPCSKVTRQDLRILFARLEQKADEGVESQLNQAELPDDTTEEEFEEAKSQFRDASKLTAMVFGEGGEQMLTTTEDGLTDRNLPDRISSIVYDSSSAVKTALNIEPRNRFVLRLDFSQPPNFDQYNPFSQPTPNISALEVTGPDDNWVSGVHDLVSQFFEARKTPRRWLHSAGVFFAVHWLAVFPAMLWFSYRFVQSLPASFSQAHPVLQSALYIYFAYLSFLVLRLIMLAVRRLWPYVELEGGERGAGRFAITAVALGVVSTFIYDVLKSLVF